MSARDKKGEGEDVVLVHGRREDGVLDVLRARRGRVEAASMRPTRDGEPLHGDLVRLRPRADAPLFDVETLYEASPPVSEKGEPEPAAETPSRSGPAQVATAGYREGWEAVFGRARKRSPASN